MHSREELVDLLENHVLQVNFIKVDGSPRTMNATRKVDFYPPLTATVPRTDNQEVIRVYDLDRKQWRSFRIDSIQSVEVVG